MSPTPKSQGRTRIGVLSPVSLATISANFTR
jgi:hypothetical protein